MTVENFAELADLFSRVCDVVERNYHGWPLEDPTGMRHTSDAARAAAQRIFKLMLPDEDWQRYDAEAQRLAMRLAPELASYRERHRQ
jgi:hypothetical protein